jgi:hypothetical protein
MRAAELRGLTADRQQPTAPIQEPLGAVLDRLIVIKKCRSSLSRNTVNFT